jgi:hypothetical protein
MLRMSTDESALYILGRRIERLLFAGILILVACFVEVYFATASARFAADKPSESVQRLVSEIEKDEERLNRLFTSKPKPPPVSKPSSSGRLTEQERNVLETRNRLGLPPPEPEPPPVERKARLTDETYAGRIRDIINKAAIDTGTNPEDISKLVDLKKSPRDIAVALRERLATAAKKPVEVWGIETPRLLEVQYGGLQYKIPASFVATVLAAALAPLLIGWLGSLYITRQRELLIIARLEDYKIAFPHILNLIPVVFENVNKRLGIEEGKRKTIRITRTLNRILLLLFRWFVLGLYTVPMVGMFALATVAFWVVEGQRFTAQIWMLVGLILIMGFQVLNLLSQELVVLWGKDFTE